MMQNKKLYTALALAGTTPALALLLIDLRLRTGDIISAMYFRVRTVATLIAILSLLVIIASPR